MSHTILLGEIRAGLTDYDLRGVWAMSAVVPAACGPAATPSRADDFGPNCLMPEADDMVNCSQLEKAYGGGETASLNAWMPCWACDGPNFQQTARSLHSGGVYVAFGDGSVHWISDLINCSPSSLGDPSVWDCLIASGDGKTLLSDQY